MGNDKPPGFSDFLIKVTEVAKTLCSDTRAERC